MKRITFLLSCLFSFITYASDLCAKPFIRDTMSLNFGWQFHYGDEHGDWQEVDLPHDFQISQPWVAPGQDEKVDTRDAAANFASTLSARAFKELGTGWYRRNLDIDDSMKGKRLVLSFEGIMLVGDVYLDGERIGGTDYGYLGFEIDITDKVKYGASHELMVRADTMGPFNSRWYTGGGLFRDVNLVVTPRNGYFTRHPLYIRTEGVDGTDAKVAVSAGVWLRGRDSLVRFGVKMLDARGVVVAEQETLARYKRYQRGADYELEPLTIRNANLWRCEDPYLYTVEVSLYDASGKVIDQVREPFGIRTIEYSPEFGFRLNGEKVLLKGAANHHTLGPLGAAAYPRAEEFHLYTLKSFGYNHVRTSHNPYSESFMDACDRLGILVVDELYDKWNTQYVGGRCDWKMLWQDHIGEWVRRDRNHPCVVMWSLGNELQQNAEPFGDYGVTAYRLMRELLRKYDKTRPTTVAMHPRYRNWETEQLPCDLALETEIASYNYRYMYFPQDAERYPHMIFYQSEANTSGIPANWYGMDLDKVVGLAYWGAVDYLGESGGWPAKGWAQGAFDISWQPKPYAYHVKSMFSDEPLVRIAVIENVAKDNVWNGVKIGTAHMSEDWNRTTGDKVDLYIFTNAEEVELLVNGKSIGVRRNSIEPRHRNRIRWEKVPYHAGKIEAVARRNGEEVARHSLETSGKAVAFESESLTHGWKADGKDLQFIRITAVDSAGRRVWDADDRLDFRVEGNASLVGLQSGDITSDELSVDTCVRLFNGSALVILRSGTESGDVTLKITSPTLNRTGEVCLEMR